MKREGFSEGEIVAGRYQIRHWVGCGSSAQLYAATNLVTAKIVALKVPNSEQCSPTWRKNERSLREAQLAARVAHPNLLDIYDVDQHRGLLVLVMEYCQGMTLDQASAHSAWSPRSALRIVGRLLLGVSALHQAGIVHADLKPRNIVMCRDEFAELERPKIVDFGSAFLRGDQGRVRSAHCRPMRVGRHVAPELVTGHAPADERVDVFALGSILDFLLSRSSSGSQRPHGGRSDWNADADAWLQRRMQTLVKQAMAPDPRDRFFSAAAFLRALDARAWSLLRIIGGGEPSAYNERGNGWSSNV